MYLAVAVIEAPAEPGDVPALQRAIEGSRARSDQVEHVCVDRQGDRAIIAVYLLGPDSETANQAAEQLVRRSAVSWRGLQPWRLRSCAARLIGVVDAV